MSRLLVIFATFAFFAPCESVNAQLRGRFWNRGSHRAGSHHSQSHQNRYRGYGGYRSSTPWTLFGFSFGTTPYGYDYAGYPDPYFTYPYSYDPWLRGSFRAPDLLDDPYFYDRVPSANRYSSPRFVRPLASTTRMPSITDGSGVEFETYADGNSVLSKPPTSQASDESLQSASERLLLSLASYGGGDAWIEYLSPDRIHELAEEGNTTELRELMARFDGVSQNHQLQVVAQISGFAETRFLLRQYLSQPIKSSPRQIDEPTFESLPSPPPEPILESPANDSLDL